MKSINGHTQIIGVFGWPLTYTLSPAFQNAALRQRNINAAYLPFPVEKAKDLERLFKALKAMKSFCGANVTNPYKLRALKFGSPSPQARAIGAANTLYRRAGRWVAHNTDAEGFVLSLKAHGIRLKGQRVLLLGSGGSARALAYAIAKSGAKDLSIASRRKGRAALLASKFGGRAHKLDRANLRGLLEHSDLLVNTVPGGDFAREAARALKGQKTIKAVCDISYGLRRNPLLNQARSMGLKAADGIGMLVEQGALSFKLFTGKAAPRKAMYKALRTHIDFEA